MDAGFVLQLVNGLAVCWLGTESVLSWGQRPPAVPRGALGAWAAANAVSFLAHLDVLAALEQETGSAVRARAGDLVRVLSLPVTFPLALLDGLLRSTLGPSGLVSLYASAAVLVVAAARSLRAGDSIATLLKSPLWAGSFLCLWALLGAFLSATGALGGVEVDSRVVVVAGAFYSLCLWDVRRQKSDLSQEEFLAHFMMASAKALLFLPVVTVVVAFGFLLVVALLEAVHLPTAWLNRPIYYGALYGPFCSTYYFAKRQVMSARLLPL